MKYQTRSIQVEARQMPEPSDDADHNDSVEAMDIYLWVEENTAGSFEPMDRIEGRLPWPETGVTIDPSDGRMIIVQQKEPIWVNLGDWIVLTEDKKFLVLNPKTFAGQYEPYVAESLEERFHDIEDRLHLLETR